MEVGGKGWVVAVRCRVFPSLTAWKLNYSVSLVRHTQVQFFFCTR